MLAKLTPVVNFINVLRAAFAPVFFPFAKKFQIQTVTREKLSKNDFVYKKAARKMLAELTPGQSS